MRLNISLGGRALEEQSFNADVRRIGVGRAPGNELVLENAALSRHHFELERRSGGWRLRDLASTNGVFVNGDKVQLSSPVQDGDVIAVGKFSLVVAFDEGDQSAHAGDPTCDPVHQGYMDVRFLDAPPRVILLNRDSLHVGRHPSCELRLEGWRVPSRLALIARGQGGFNLVNLAGRAVYHNSKPLSLRTRLREGDRIELATALATFHLGQPEQRI